MKDDLCDPTEGNYDISILILALKKHFDVIFTRLYKDNVASLLDGTLLTETTAFLLTDHHQGVYSNTNHHFAIIKKYEHWFFLDSLMPQPVLLPTTSTHWLLVQYYNTANLTLHYTDDKSCDVSNNKSEGDEDSRELGQYYAMKNCYAAGLACIQYQIMQYAWTNHEKCEIYRMDELFHRMNWVHDVSGCNLGDSKDVSTYNAKEIIDVDESEEICQNEDYLFTNVRDNTSFQDIDAKLIDDSPDCMVDSIVSGNIFIINMILYPETHVSSTTCTSFRNMWTRKMRKHSREDDSASNFLHKKIGDGNEHSTPDKLMTFGMLKMILESKIVQGFEMEQITSYKEWEEVENLQRQASFVLITGIRKRYCSSTSMEKDMKKYCVSVRDDKLMDSSSNIKFRSTVDFLPTQRCVFANYFRNKLNNSPEPYSQYILDMADNGNLVGSRSMFNVIESMVSITIKPKHLTSTIKGEEK